jgi:hypothetical protein
LAINAITIQGRPVSETEVRQFIAMVLQGGEVAERPLRTNVPKA